MTVHGKAAYQTRDRVDSLKREIIDTVRAMEYLTQFYINLQKTSNAKVSDR